MKSKKNLIKKNLKRVNKRKNISSPLKYIAGIFVFIALSYTIFASMQRKAEINEIGGGIAATNNKNALTVSTKTTLNNSTANIKPVENKDRKMSSGRCDTDNCVKEDQTGNSYLNLVNDANIVLEKIGLGPIGGEARNLTTTNTKSDELASRINSSSNDVDSFANMIANNRRAVDAAGNQIETTVSTSNNPDGTTTTQTTQVTTNPDTGNSSTTITIVKTNSEGKVVTESSATSTRTRNVDGSYSMVVTDNRGNVTYKNDATNTSSDTNTHKDSRDIVVGTTGSNNSLSSSGQSNVNPSAGDSNIPTPTTFTCPNNKVPVETSKGIQCASTTAQDCDNLGLRINGRCYMIGEKTSDGFEVCDWTKGARPGVQYPFQSKNCPTKTEPVATEPKSAVECGLQGWWNDKENGGKGRCVKVGEQIANSDLVVCKGGATSEGYKFNRPYNAKKSDCPDFSSTNLTIPINPNETNLGNTIATPTIDPKDGAYTLPPAFDNAPPDQDKFKYNLVEDAKKPVKCLRSCQSGYTCVRESITLFGTCKPNNPIQQNVELKNDSSGVNDSERESTTPEVLKSEKSSKSCWYDWQCNGNECVGGKTLDLGVCGGLPRAMQDLADREPDTSAKLAVGDRCYIFHLAGKSCDKCPYNEFYDANGSEPGNELTCGIKEE